LRHFTSNRRKGLSGGVRGGSSSSRRIKYRALFTLLTVSGPVGHPPSYRGNLAPLKQRRRIPAPKEAGKVGRTKRKLLTQAGGTSTRA
jgi:hypothetical protein